MKFCDEQEKLHNTVVVGGNPFMTQLLREGVQQQKEADDVIIPLIWNTTIKTTFESRICPLFWNLKTLNNFENLM